MSTKVQPYRVIDLPVSRREVGNFIDLWKHPMYGLLEVDVTVARGFIEAHRARTGETLSFTGYMVYCLARAVDEHKAVQAYRKGRSQLVIFDDVNVGIMVERKVGEKRELAGHVIRAAHQKTYLEIHQEIRSAQSGPVHPTGGIPSWVRLLTSLPWPISAWFNASVRAVMRRDPTIFASLIGTVGVTAVGMFGKGIAGWGIVPTPFSLALVVGSTTRKPAVVEDRIEPREVLNLTMVFDHDVIDGGPAARFARRLVELIESGSGLPDDRSMPPGEAGPVSLKPEPVIA